MHERTGSQYITNHRTADRHIAVITGASKGIGRAVAEQLAAQGTTVVIGARDPGRGGSGGRPATSGRV